MATVTIDALDAIELAEIVEYFMERLDILAEQDLGTLPFTASSPYGLDDLPVDLTRLIHRLHTAPMTSLTNVGASICSAGPGRLSLRACW